MKVVVDTNIMLVSVAETSKYHVTFQALLQGKYTLCVTNEILNEYEEIIGRFLGEQVATSVIELLLKLPNVELITPHYHLEIIQTDPDDNKFVDCAFAANANFITTNDKHFNILKLLPFPQFNVISLQEFIKILNL
ncbi:MAG: putative toxin-antitoxin system toxin component, PIN family [Thermoflexibacter sp.]|jgi:putative PIN family toxin of toxin-antitoxin system|nr:putative toxin-antitoxin system toxin component, PIN family [Thermoflexibacter sp.]